MSIKREIMDYNVAVAHLMTVYNNCDFEMLDLEHPIDLAEILFLKSLIFKEIEKHVAKEGQK